MYDVNTYYFSSRRSYLTFEVDNKIPPCLIIGGGVMCASLPFHFLCFYLNNKHFLPTSRSNIVVMLCCNTQINRYTLSLQVIIIDYFTQWFPKALYKKHGLHLGNNITSLDLAQLGLDSLYWSWAFSCDLFFKYHLRPYVRNCKESSSDGCKSSIGS